MKTGNKVKVSIYCNDPINMKGEIGIVTNIKWLDDENADVWVQFPNGKKGCYQIECLEIVN